LFGEDDDDEPIFQFDPRSTDFGKVRAGDTRLDVTAGLSTAIVFSTRVMMQQKMSQRGEIQDMRLIDDGDNIRFGQMTTSEVIGRFLRSKLAPIPSAAVNIVDGQNVVGETYKEGAEFMRDGMGLPAGFAENPFVQELIGFGVPLSIADYYDAARAHGIPKASALQILATLGVSMNTYSIESEKKGRSERTRKQRPKRPKRPRRER
jgi:hypothetical protein